MPDFQKIGQLYRQLSGIYADLADELGSGGAGSIPMPRPGKLSLLEAVQNNDWPLAVPTDEVVTADDQKEDRARNILNYIVTASLSGKKFLDFGCGEGHVAKVAASMCDKSVGYDLVKPTLEGEDKLLLTDSLEEVAEAGPYDVALLFDVLDHSENPVEVLRTVKSLCVPGASVFIRCHPWSSRHGSHLYKTLNKAFVHLVLTEEEIATLTNEKIDCKQRVLSPQMTYRNWLTTAGLTELNLVVEKDTVEPYFYNTQGVKGAFMAAFGRNRGGSFPTQNMEQSFIDITARV
jgi:2-polyprenyl-3-methyl-5-hydroxy-6-metoxy-1,4-benzoquinol methylase